MQYLDQSDIERLLAVWDPSRTLKDIRVASGGLYNMVYFLSTSRGCCVLRIAPTDDIPKLFYEKKMMHAEHFLHNLVRESTSVPIPEIYFYDFSRRIFDQDYLFMELIKGTTGFINLNELGRFVRKLHSIQGRQFGYPNRGLPIHSTWRETFIAYARMILNNCLSVKAFDSATYTHFLEAFYRNESVFAEPVPALLHLDLWSANILSQNERITGILDFDRGMFGDPELEFAVLDTYGMATAEFFAGYGASRPMSRSSDIRRRLYTVYELIKYTFIRLARGGSQSASQYHLEQCKNLIKDLK